MKLKGFEKRLFVVNCKTFDEAVDFTQILAEQGYQWNGKEGLYLTYWSDYEENTFYIHKGGMKIQYGNINARLGRTVLTFEEFMSDESIWIFNREKMYTVLREEIEVYGRLTGDVEFEKVKLEKLDKIYADPEHWTKKVDGKKITLFGFDSESRTYGYCSISMKIYRNYCEVIE